MIIVTGTKRSGTSMWMQLLVAAGYPPIGNMFSKDWEKTIKDANPRGFYESELRRGIYHATNPHPKTGVFLFPQQTRGNVVKVFIPGLIRTDYAFIDRVVATVRPWREYARSVQRLNEMDLKALREKTKGSDIPDPVYLSPALEWWSENFSLISDIVTRRYPAYVLAYDSVLTDPDKTIHEVIKWLGHGDADKAIAGVDRSLRTQKEPEDFDESEFDPDIVRVFDDYYDVVCNQRTLTQDFVDVMNQTNAKLEARIDKETKRVSRANTKRKKIASAWAAKKKNAEKKDNP